MGLTSGFRFRVFARSAKNRLTIKTLAPLHFEYLFLRGKLGLGPGMAVRFAKAPAGISAFIFETKRDSAKEGGRS
jgi:hypothetical protein